MQDFLSEDTKVEIVPAFDCPTLSFISCDYGPFIAGMSVPVPLWLAVELRKQFRCRITPPPWLCESYLTEVLNYEKDPMNETFFTSSEHPSNPDIQLTLPYHYQSIARVLIDVCPGDIERVKSINVILQDIDFLRNSKSVNILKRLSLSMDGTEGEEVQRNFNMRSGWKGMEVQEFKGVTVKMLEGVRGGEGEGRGEGRGGRGAGNDGRKEGRRKFRNERRREEDGMGGDETPTAKPGRKPTGTPTIDEDGLEVAQIEEGEELEEPTRQGAQRLRRFR
ncbi:hypothetical protein TrVE_jg8899 [Triparma verrucosa]|uniref:DNA replication complex GINS protein PSF2 N-terminal domain-containing protein n=1 Tax=Triparma verrucosa TaxID=1606542 RepID=A0A9W7BTC1_9STRA|nr:hypothetical protein TrVE_jg8899 [Triparma verrucosa]